MGIWKGYPAYGAFVKRWHGRCDHCGKEIGIEKMTKAEFLKTLEAQGVLRKTYQGEVHWFCSGKCDREYSVK